jgi:hypothetical protein
VRLTGLLSVAFAAALFTACSSGGAPANARISTPSPIAAGTPSPLVIPSPTIPFLRCDTVDLEMQLIHVGVGLGNVGGLIEARNKSSRDCDLYGYAGVQLLDSIGRPLPTKVIWSTSSYIFGVDQVEVVVGLPAGTVPINPDRPVPGHAYLPISWNEVQEPCSEAAKLKVTPPDAYNSLVISASPAGGAPGVMYFCSGGTVIINPTRAAQAF